MVQAISQNETSGAHEDGGKTNDGAAQRGTHETWGRQANTQSFQFGVLADYLSRDRVEFGFGLGAGYPRFQAAQSPEVPVAPLVEPGIARLDLRLHGNGHEEFRTEDEFGAEETARHHAKDGVVEPVELYGLAGDGGIGGETALPTVIAEDNDGMSAGLLIVGGG